MNNRRNEVIRGAAEEIAEHGFSQASFATIARKLGMSKGHLQYYVKTKDALAQEIVDRAYPGNKLVPSVDELPSGTSGLLALVSKMANDYVSSPYSRASACIFEEGAVIPITAPRLHTEWLRLVEQLAEQAVRDGELVEHLNIPDFAIRYLGLFVGTRIVCLMLGDLEMIPGRTVASAQQLISANAQN